MNVVILAFILATTAAYSAAGGDDDVSVICLSSTTYKMRVEVEDIYITTPAFECPAGQVCDERRRLPCVPVWDGSNVPSECTESGVFANSDPCSSIFYVCINTIFHGFFKKNLTCGPYKSYNERKEDCEIKPLECNSPFSWRTAIPSRLDSVPIAAPVATVSEIIVSKSTTTTSSTSSAAAPTTSAQSTTPLPETAPTTTTSANTEPMSTTTTPASSTSTATPPTTTTTAPRAVVSSPTSTPTFICPHSGKFAVPNSCNEYYICRKIFWSLSYFKATCYGHLQFSSLKQKCVPSWLSDCGIANAEVPWWFQHRGIGAKDHSSEEDW